ncbi:OmcA/MtrC family decaheme c-type cytochrome [Shewanella sp. AS1]|uniref:OmcA/MtrC family decaheme c-type cytochrome n=1 Tax=Shewanella sp. AS1 TaxID=2907626 RepID=UPI001F25F932|nr:OmcA/MtrC family decaheme c-type cytochrome [Shewanella sp. AS1]MCE9678227.1 OmcA/MtrC family decaheme c-type cytochrome [Shewanella sp. AS1]
MMKQSQFNAATKALLSAGLLSLVLTGCGGSDGKTGEPGISGPVGLDISEVTSLNATLEDANIDNGAVSVDIVVTNANGVPVTGLEQANLSTLGLGIAKLVPQQGKGYKTPQWISYINSVKAADPARSLTNYTYNDGKRDIDVNFAPGDAIQAGIESSCKTQCLTVVEPGVYRYTFETNLNNLAPIDTLDLTYDETLVHRITLELQTERGNGDQLVNTHIDFIPAQDFKVAEPEETRTVVSLEANCIKCHNTNYNDASSTAKPLAMHGGKRVAIENCQVCHNSYSKDPETGATLDLAAMAHKIHKGTYTMVGHGGSINDFSGTIAKAAASSTGYPLFDADKDHSEKVTLPVSVGECQTCHSTDDKGPADADAFKHQRGLACASCHMTDVAPVDIKDYFHKNATPDTDGIYGADLVGRKVADSCGACHADQGEQGSATYHLAKANAAQSLRSEYAYTLENGKFDAATGELTFTVDWHNDVAPHQDPKVKEFWVSLTAFDGTEYIMGARPSNGALGRSESRISVNLAGVDTNANLTASANGSAITYTLTGITVAGTATSEPYMQIVNIGQGFMDGKLILCANSAEVDPAVNAAIDCSDTTASIYDVIVGSPKVSFSADGSDVKPRRSVTSEAKCANCHGEQADFSASHTATKGSDTPDNSCGTCHSAVPNTAVSLADGSCATCHNGAPAHSQKPFERGFDFKVMIHQIHADTRSQRRTTSDEATFPENPANCAACHDKGQLSLEGLSEKTAFVAKNGEFSPTVAACASCHAPTTDDNASVISHFQNNGGVYEGAPGTYVAGDETCVVCHAEGKSVGIDKVHPTQY